MMEQMYDLSDYPDNPDDTPPVCERCGADTGLTYGPDPYGLEINDDDTPIWLCLECLQESADGI